MSLHNLTYELSGILHDYQNLDVNCGFRYLLYIILYSLILKYITGINNYIPVNTMQHIYLCFGVPLFVICLSVFLITSRLINRY